VCSLVEIYQYFRVSCCLHIYQGTQKIEAACAFRLSVNYYQAAKKKCSVSSEELVSLAVLHSEMGGACGMYGGGERRGAYGVLVGKPEGKRPLEKCRHRWEDNIKVDLQEISWEGMDWIDLA
jgi:hypothetical protein